MNQPDELNKIVREALPPIGDTELQRDLWPQMLRRLDQRSPRVHWLDWALAAAVLVSFFVFPEAVLGFFYQL